MKSNLLFTVILSFLFIGFSSAQTVNGPNAGFFCSTLASGDLDMVGFRLKNLSNGAGGEMELYVGTGDLGVATNRDDSDFTWGTSHSVTFTLDGAGMATIDVDGTTASYDVSMAAFDNGVGLDDLNHLCFGIREGGGDAEIADLTINGSNVGTFGDDNSNWTVTDLCLGDPSATQEISFTLNLSGTFGNNENSKVEFLLGATEDSNCGTMTPPAAPIPTMGQWGVIILGISMMIFGLVFVTQRRKKTSIA